ncbi:MAG: hypothetical protein HUU55_08885 [Myxococcales bacterium]|nr:hypothetical protein [Myxococcales bacterium]
MVIMDSRNAPGGFRYLFAVVLGLLLNFFPEAGQSQQLAATPDRARACYETDPQFRKLYDAAEVAVRHETSMHEAPVLFRLAYWSCPTVSAKLSEALALLSLRRYMDAHAVLQPLAGSPNREVRDEARKLLADLDAEMDKEGFGNLTLRYSPAWAEVLVDGVPATTANGLLLWRLAPGKYKVSLRADSHTPVQVEVVMGSAESVSREVTLAFVQDATGVSP